MAEKRGRGGQEKPRGVSGAQEKPTEALRESADQVFLTRLRHQTQNKGNPLETAFGLFSFDLRAALRLEHMRPTQLPEATFRHCLLRTTAGGSHGPGWWPGDAKEQCVPTPALAESSWTT